MERLKIALLSRWYWEENRHQSHGGGAVTQLAEAVAALGHEVVVLSQSPEVASLKKTQIGALEAWLSPRDKKRDFLTGLRDKWAKQTYRHRKVYSDARALGDFLAQRGPFDVLWAQAEEPDGLVAAIAARLGISLPPVLTQIQALRYRFEKGVPIFSEQPALSAAFQQAKRILANSTLVAESLSHYASPQLIAENLQQKVRIVHPNLQRNFLQAANQMSITHPSEPVRVLFLGALNEGKGGLTFLDAMGKTAAADKGAIFSVIGDFTEKNPAFAQQWKDAVAAQGKLASQLELLGKVPSFEVIRYIRLAHVVVLPSLFDAFSRALIEALILGRPVVTTDRVGAASLVQAHGCGVVIPPNDPTALAQAIDSVLAPDAPYAQKARQVAHRLLHEFSPEAIARQVARQLEETAKLS